MKMVLRGLFVIIVVCVASHLGLSQDTVRKQERTYAGPVVDNTNAVRSPTFGYAAEAFIPDCEVWFYGELIDQVPEPSGRTRTGIFIRKTATEVTINGRVYVSVYDKPREPKHPLDPAIEERVRISQAAVRQFQRKAKPHAELAGAYAVDGRVYKPNIPKPFTLGGGDTTVTVTVKPKHMGGVDYVCVEYAGDRAYYSLYSGPKLTQGEQNEQRLDVVFNGFVGSCRPGRIVVYGSGATMVFPQRLRSAVKDALAQIPELAVPTHEDFYGEMMYERLTINGLTFDSDTIRDFVKASRR